MKDKKIRLTIGIFILCGTLAAQSTNWPEVQKEARPGTRWWWMGSSVDKENLTYNLEEYAAKGMGSVEITPIYGVQGKDELEIAHLSPEWMEMYKHVVSQTNHLDMLTDMNTGTGWPFGGPEVTIEDAATKLVTSEYLLQGGKKLTEKIEVSDEGQKPYATLNKLMAFSKDGKKLDLTARVKEDGTLDWKAPKGEWRLIAVFNGKTLQQVKRAAPGGEGYVMDHLSATAVARYLAKFDKAFTAANAPYPHNFFNDSYEVYGGDWTPDFFEEFEKRRGYKLEEYLPEFLESERIEEATEADSWYDAEPGKQRELSIRLLSDYRETIGELLLENFTRQWTGWANDRGSQTRNQAHGSPGNLIDLYATVDVPECEGFGLSHFGIKGLRTDTITRKNDSDLSMLKYASSGAHIAGKPFTSSETFTWLTEHFRTSLSQCKPELDLFFVAGVNHIFFHGSTYSPKEEAWPGWKFYATVDMSPTNTIWRDAEGMFSYITRSQSFLQYGEPDNDFLVYLPVYDMWSKPGTSRLLMFDIHGMEKRAPKFIETIHTISASGYDVDYISDNFIRTTVCEAGKLKTTGGATYQAIIIPAVQLMPDDVFEHLLELAAQGAKIIFMENYPQDVPGFANLEQRREKLNALKAQLPAISGFHTTTASGYRKGEIITGTDYSETLAATGVIPEELKTKYGLSSIRRRNPDGHHYFISSLQPEGADGWVTLAVNAQSAMYFDPMTGKTGKAALRHENGKTRVKLQLASGASIILKTFATDDVEVSEWNYWTPSGEAVVIDKGWSLSFIESDPQLPGTFEIDQLGSWTELDAREAAINKGTALYTATFDLPVSGNNHWILDLGDVRESARIRLNGEDAGLVWAVPYRIEVGQYLKPGKNTIEVEVTNLPANRIADYDRRNVPWRKFKEINLVDLNYKGTTYGHWDPMESGLLGEVKLIPVVNE